MLQKLKMLPYLLLLSALLISGCGGDSNDDEDTSARSDQNPGFTELSAGTYSASLEDDSSPTIFVLNDDLSGKWIYNDEGGAISWRINSDGTLVVSFSEGGTEEYTITSGTLTDGKVKVEFTDEPDTTAGWGKLEAFASLVAGEYSSQAGTDSQATTFVLNADFSGAWSFGDEGGTITWKVEPNDTLVLTFEGGGTEIYTLTSGTFSSGTVHVEFSNEPSVTANWSKVN